MDSDTARVIQALQQRIARLETKPGPLYLVGTFTPTYLGSAVPGATTYVVQQGAWRRLGDRVDFTLTLQWSAATGTGNPRIGGLPFPSANVGNQNYACAIWPTTVTFANAGITVLFSPNVSELRLFSPASNVATTELVMEATGLVVISGWYQI
jgi:hypothetical protein